MIEYPAGSRLRTQAHKVPAGRAPFWGSVMKHIALVFSFALLLASHADAQTPRKGGTIRMTAPYGTNISTLDMHATVRAQDDIYGHVVHRTLYIYDSEKGVPELELAKSVTVSNNGLTHTFKLRDDAFFHNGKKMTADDIIYSFTRIMDGKRAFPAARWVRIIKGAVDVEDVLCDLRTYDCIKRDIRLGYLRRVSDLVRQPFRRAAPFA